MIKLSSSTLLRLFQVPKKTEKVSLSLRILTTLRALPASVVLTICIIWSWDEIGPAINNNYREVCNIFPRIFGIWTIILSKKVALWMPFVSKTGVAHRMINDAEQFLSFFQCIFLNIMLRRRHHSYDFYILTHLSVLSAGPGTVDDSLSLHLQWRWVVRDFGYLEH